jgi:hypothetical protein
MLEEDHTVHHLLALYSLGATPDQIQAMYDLNKRYQSLVQYRPASVAVRLRDRAFFQQCLGNLSYYESFVRFFQDEIAERGIPDVVNGTLFQRDDVSDDILGRMHSGKTVASPPLNAKSLILSSRPGFLHPMIHLGCALEFNQPLLVAEALAAGCVHDDWPRLFLFPVEEYVQGTPETPARSMLEILDQLHHDPAIKNAVQMSDPLNKISDGLLAKARENLIPYLAQYRVQPTANTLQTHMVDMVHSCAYMVGAAQHPGKVEALDFVLLHALTLSVFYQAFLAQDWITSENKARLLHFKAWGDMVMYAGCGCPELCAERVTEYVPKQPSHGWKQLAHRACVYEDDGHISKVVRALLHAESLPDPRTGFPLLKADFQKIAHLGLDSVERMLEPGQYKVPAKIQKEVGEEMGQAEDIIRVMVRWVRWCGVSGAWEEFPDLEMSSSSPG